MTWEGTGVTGEPINDTQLPACCRDALVSPSPSRPSRARIEQVQAACTISRRVKHYRACVQGIQVLRATVQMAIRHDPGEASAGLDKIGALLASLREQIAHIQGK